jgi:predicted nucleotidyltransferase
MAEIIIEKAKDFLLKKEQAETLFKLEVRKRIVSELKKLGSIWEKYGVEKAYLYGSMADMTFNRYSDIDIAVEPDISYENQLKLFSEINRHIKREVDIRVLKELPFAEKIIRTGFIVYERKNSHTEERDRTRYSTAEQII